MQRIRSASLPRLLARAGLALGLAVAGQAVFMPSALAAVLTVNTTADVATSYGACGNTALTAPVNSASVSLREATCVANNAGATSSTINIPAGGYHLANGELQLGTVSGSDISLVGAGQASTIIDADGLSRVLDLDPGLVGGMTTSISGVTITGGNDSIYGGAGIIAGSGNAGAADSLTISASTISDNHANTGGSTSTESPGGGVQFIGGSLSISNSTISGNSSGNSSGSGVFYQGQGILSDEHVGITGSTFSGNSAVAPVSGRPNGGALSLNASGGATYTVSNSRFVNNTVAGGSTGSASGAAIWSQSGALTVTGGTFTGNSLTGASQAGGAVSVTGGSAVLHYNRITGNSATSGSGVFHGVGATVNATDNWWGCNTGPGTAGCDTVAGSPTVAPRLVLTVSATPEIQVGRSASHSIVTATLTQDSAGSAVDPAQLGAFDGLPVSWTEPQPAAALIVPASSNLSAGSAITTYYICNSTCDSGQVNATLDGGSATVVIVWATRPPHVMMNPTDQQVQPGTSASFDAVASGRPAPTAQWQVSTDGGASFTDIAGATSTRFASTAQLSDDGNKYRAVFSNGVGSPAITTAATLNVAVNQAPAVTTNPSDETVNAGSSVSFTAAASGFPTPFVWWYRSTDGGATFSYVSAGYSTTYTFTAASGDDGNQYRAVFSNAAGSVTSTAATLRINNAPTISSANTTTFTVGTAGSFTLTTTGFPYPTLTTVGTLPAWSSFTDNGNGTATLSGTPPAGTSGSYPITIKVSNGIGPDASQAFTLTVRAPVFTSADHATFVLVSAGSFSVTTSGGADPVSITEVGTLPSGVTFTDNGNGTAVLVGTPPAGSAGVYRFTLNAATGFNQPASQSFTLFVGESPSITSADHTTFAVGTARSFTVTTTAGYPRATTITKTGTLPAGVTFTDNGDGTATLAGTPTAGGSFPITITASNGVAPDASQAFTLTVNAPPVFTSADHATFAAGSAGSFTVTATPGNPPATTLSINGTPLGLSFTDNGDGTATLAGTPSRGEQLAYTIMASNGTSLYALQLFTVTVTQAPVIVSSNSIAFSVGSAGSFTVRGLGGVPKATTITETGALPTGVTFTDNGDGTATLAGTPPAGTDGSYPLTISVSNTAGTTQQAFTLMVVPPNSSPVITSADHATFAVGSICKFTVTTIAGYPVATTITKTGTLPSGVTFTGNGGTGMLSGIPVSGTGGSYSLTFTASNGLLPNWSQTFTLTVTEPPALSSTDHTTFLVGTAGSFTVRGVGAFPTATTITKTGALPAGVNFTDNGDGTATIAGTPTAAGAFPLTITASNGASADATQSFTLTVTKLPVITSGTVATFVTGTAGSFTVTTTAGYPAATTITKAGTLPAGVNFTHNGDGTATIAGTPGAGTAGSYPLTFTAANSAGSTQQAFTLTVQPANASPVITSATAATFRKGSAGSFTVTTTAGYPAATTITKTGALPAGVTFTDNHDGTATIAGAPTVAGAFTITITASNGASTNATQSFTLTVNAPPVITSANTVTFTSNVAGQSFTVTTAAGFPTASTITKTGTLPAGVTFTDNHNGTATIAGTPTVAASANYALVITASNGISPNATQNFTLKVTKLAVVTLPASKPEPAGTLAGVPGNVRIGQVLTASHAGFTTGSRTVTAARPG